MDFCINYQIRKYFQIRKLYQLLARSMEYVRIPTYSKSRPKMDVFLIIISSPYVFSI
jgi:hypothetical protein